MHFWRLSPKIKPRQEATQRFAGIDAERSLMSVRPFLHRNLTEFFRELLQSAMRSQAVRSSEDTEFYLVRLLEGFAHADAPWFERPLALDYLESFHAPVAHRYGKLKRVADTALFMSGVFMESLHRQLVSSDYYMDLGRVAYSHLSALSNGVGVLPGDLFAELAERFPDFVRVLAEISFERLFHGDSHTLRVYTRWMYTRNERDAAWLLRHGIIAYAPASTRRH